MHAQHADVREKIAGGDWSEETQKAVHAAVDAFAEDFGYDLDEEGQPLEDDARAAARVGGRRRLQRRGHGRDREREERRSRLAGVRRNCTHGLPARRQEPDRLGQEHPEDHACDGDGRRRAPAPRRAAHRGAAPLRRRDPADDPPGRAGRRRRGLAAAAARRARVRDATSACCSSPAIAAWPAASTRRSSAPACASAPSSARRACRRVWYATGRRGVSSLTFRGHDLSGSYTGFTDRPSYADARTIADDLIDAYVDGELDRVEIVYNCYVSPLTQKVTRETLLPLSAGDDRRRGARGGRRARPRQGPRALVDYEPDPEEILRAARARTTSRSRSTARWSSPPPASSARR